MGSLPFQVQGRDTCVAESAMTVCGCTGQSHNAVTSGVTCGEALLIHVEREHRRTAISTLAYSIEAAAHCLKPLRAHV